MLYSKKIVTNLLYNSNLKLQNLKSKSNINEFNKFVNEHIKGNIKK